MRNDTSWKNGSKYPSTREILSTINKFFCRFQSLLKLFKYFEFLALFQKKAQLKLKRRYGDKVQIRRKCN